MDYPKDWKKTLEELFEEDRDIPSEEIQWARAYEKEMLRNNVRFPLNGEIFEAIEDVKISYLTQWRAPFTGGEDFIIKKGTRIKVEVEEYEAEPILVYATALEHEKLEKEIIPEKDRTNSKYAGYYLSVKTKTLDQSFQLKSPNK